MITWGERQHQRLSRNAKCLRWKSPGWWRSGAMGVLKYSSSAKHTERSAQTARPVNTWKSLRGWHLAASDAAEADGGRAYTCLERGPSGSPGESRLTAGAPRGAAGEKGSGRAAGCLSRDDGFSPPRGRGLREPPPRPCLGDPGVGAAGAGRLGARQGLGTGQGALVLQPALHHPHSPLTWLSLGPGPADFSTKHKGRGNSGAWTCTRPLRRHPWLAPWGREASEADRPPGSGSTENLVTPACPGPHLPAPSPPKAGLGDCEMKLSLSLWFPWVFHPLGKLQTFSKWIVDFPECFFIVLWLIVFLFFFFFGAKLCASYLTALWENSYVVCPSAFFGLAQRSWIIWELISLFSYSLFQSSEALFFIEQFLLHLWEFSLQLFDLLWENVNMNVCK